MDKLHIKGELLESGGRARINFLKNQTENLEIYPSYIFDGLHNLLCTICLFNKGIDEVVGGIFGEGINYLVYIQKIDNQSINFKIFEYYDYKGEPTLDQIYTDELIFEVITNLKKLNHQIINLFYSFEKEYGLKGYEEKWFKDFPLDKYLELQKLQKNL